MSRIERMFVIHVHIVFVTQTKIGTISAAWL